MSTSHTQRKTDNLQASSERTDRKRKCDPQDFRALLQEDFEKQKSKTLRHSGTKRPADAILSDDSVRPKVPRLLGPILGERFKALQLRINARL